MCPCPAPPSTRSVPSPPSRKSWPPPPSSMVVPRGGPRPAFALSAPRPRKSSSRPGPPHTKSLPWRAITRSCPRPATMTSRAAVPTSRSPPSVPTIVALCPKHVGETAVDAVPVKTRAPIAKTATRTTRFAVGPTPFFSAGGGYGLTRGRRTLPQTPNRYLLRWSTKSVMIRCEKHASSRQTARVEETFSVLGRRKPC